MSSIGSVSNTTPSYPPSSAQQDGMQKNFQALTQAIQSGNLSAASQAYAALQQNAPAGASQNGGPLAAIGSALSAGDMSGAQSAMQSLQQGMKAHHGHHHRGSQPSSDSSSQASAGSSTSPQDGTDKAAAQAGAVDVTA